MQSENNHYNLSNPVEVLENYLNLVPKAYGGYG
jgi:hypothetical protein